MQYLGLLATVAELILIIWGVALISGIFIRNRWLAFCGGPWLAATLMFSLETYHGMGSLRTFGGLFVLFSAGLIFLSASPLISQRMHPPWSARLAEWRDHFRPSSMAICGGCFLVVFAYAFAWRFAFPDVDGSSEKIADLSYISSYLPGGQIPVTDAWLHPYLSTQYYSFQHYAAALIGRMLGLDPGTTYNLAFCCLVGLIGTTFAGTIFLLNTSSFKRALLICAFVFGGTGATLIVHLTDKQVSPWSAMRYIGSAPNDRLPLGPMLAKYAARYAKMDLPGEPFAYSIYLGDYHAPLSGFYLLTLGVLAGVLWQTTQKRRYASVIGATLTWSLLANSWSLPLQGLALLFWLLANRLSWKNVLPSVLMGAATIWFAAALYLSSFTVASAGYKTSLRLVASGDHTPPLLFIIFLFPTIGLAILGILSRRRAAVWLGTASVAFLLFSEFFYVDDIYSGMYERFNTTLKWWPWIVAATLVTLGPILLDRVTKRWIRFLALFFCIYPCIYAFDLASFWSEPAKLSLGKFNGTNFIDRETLPHLMLERLKVERPGVVIERPKKDSFTNSACLPLFAGHKMWLGWLAHEQLWRGYREDLAQRQERLFQFYNGEMTAPALWLRAQGIDYAIWFQPEDTSVLWEKIDKALEPDYVWCEVYTAPDGTKAGLWKDARKISESSASAQTVR